MAPKIYAEYYFLLSLRNTVVHSKGAADITYLYSTTTSEASEVQARLEELSTRILQSSHAHSGLLRELISRQDAVSNRQEEQARVLGEQSRILEEQVRVLEEIRSSTSTGGCTSDPIVPTRPSSAVSHLPNNSDNASIMSKRSTLSFRLGRSNYVEELKTSRAYKRLRYFGLGIDSSADSVLSFDSACSTGNWSILSHMTLGDLSVSQIAVLNFPIELADIGNPRPFQEPNSTETHRTRPRGTKSSRGRIHNAIDNGNGIIIRSLLAMRMDIEELDSNGRTPLLYATVKCQEAICKLLLRKGASVEALKAFTSGMDLKERSVLLDQLLENALSEGSETVLRLLVLMAVGTNDDNRRLSQISIAIDMSYTLAVRAIIHLQPGVLGKFDADGRTPLVYAAMTHQEAICKLLLGKGASVEVLKAFTSGMDFKKRSELLDPLIKKALDNGSRTVTALRLLVLMALGTNNGGADNRSSSQSMMNVAIDMNYDLAVHAIIHFEPQVLVEVDIEGRTPLIYAVVKHQEAIYKLLLKKGTSLEPLEPFTSGMDLSRRCQLLDPLISKAMDDGLKSVTALRLLVQIALGTNTGDDNRSSSRSMIKVAIDMGHGLAVRAIIHLEPQVLVGVNTKGRTPLVHAAVRCEEAICKLLLEKGASLEPLEPFTSGMNLIQRCQLLGPLISKAIDDGSKSVTALKLLVQIALGATYGDDNRSYRQSMIKVTIDIGYGLAVHAIIHFEPQVLVEVDIEGRTPFAYAYHQRQNKICEMLIQMAKLDMVRTTEDVKLEGKLAVHAHAAIEENCPQVLWLLLGMDTDIEDFIDMEGRTLLTHVAQLILNSEIDGYGSLEGICRVLLENVNIDIEAMKKMDIARIAGSMHDLVKKDFKSIL